MLLCSMIKMKKAQISIEIIFVISLIIFMFILLMFVIFEKKIELNAIENIVADKEECNKLADIITLAFISKGNHTFMLNKNVVVSPNTRLITVSDTQYSCRIPFNRINNLSNGTFNLTEGRVNVNYRGSYVEVKNA